MTIGGVTLSMNFNHSCLSFIMSEFIKEVKNRCTVSEFIDDKRVKAKFYNMYRNHNSEKLEEVYQIRIVDLIVCSFRLFTPTFLLLQLITADVVMKFGKLVELNLLRKNLKELSRSEKEKY